MPKFLPGLRDSKSWTAVAARPRCSPAKSEMTLMEAAKQMNASNRRALQRAQAKLAAAEDQGNKGKASAARREISRIVKRG